MEVTLYSLRFKFGKQNETCDRNEHTVRRKLTRASIISDEGDALSDVVRDSRKAPGDAARTALSLVAGSPILAAKRRRPESLKAVNRRRAKSNVGLCSSQLTRVDPSLTSGAVNCSPKNQSSVRGSAQPLEAKRNWSRELTEGFSALPRRGRDAGGASGNGGEVDDPRQPLQAGFISQRGDGE